MLLYYIHIFIPSLNVDNWVSHQEILKHSASVISPHLSTRLDKCLQPIDTSKNQRLNTRLLKNGADGRRNASENVMPRGRHNRCVKCWLRRRQLIAKVMQGLRNIKIIIKYCYNVGMDILYESFESRLSVSTFGRPFLSAYPTDPVTDIPRIVIEMRRLLRTGSISD